MATPRNRAISTDSERSLRGRSSSGLLTESSARDLDLKGGEGPEEIVVDGATAAPPIDDGPPNDDSGGGKGSGITSAGFRVLVLLAVQNCSKNLLLRYVMKSKPNFLTSAAIIGVELIKLVLAAGWIALVERRSLTSILDFMMRDKRSSLLLVVPASAYSLQMSLEYVALSHLDAATFSVLVQVKLLATASFAVVLLRKRIRKAQVISLVLLTAGVMLCNLSKDYNRGGVVDEDEEGGARADAAKGIAATLMIALSSGFASVYTERVIKKQGVKKGGGPPPPPSTKAGGGADDAKGAESAHQQTYGLAYTQVQLAVVSLVILGAYAVVRDFRVIVEKGLWHNFNGPAFFSIFNSAIGGLTVAAVLKYADAVLKGYATAVSVVLTGVLSVILFGTSLNVIYFLGIINVVCAVLLYNATDLDRLLC